MSTLPSAEDHCASTEHEMVKRMKLQCMECNSIRGYARAVLEAAAGVAGLYVFRQSDGTHVPIGDELANRIRELKEDLA